MKKLNLLLLLLVVGCDKIVSTEIIGESRQEVRTVSCTHPSYCYTMMPGFDGKMKAQFKLSAYCPGNRDALVKITPVRYKYESGKERISEQKKIIEYKSSCT